MRIGRGTGLLGSCLPSVTVTRRPEPPADSGSLTDAEYSDGLRAQNGEENKTARPVEINGIALRPGYGGPR